MRVQCCRRSVHWQVDHALPRVARPPTVHPHAEGEAEAAADYPRAGDGVEVGVARAPVRVRPVDRAGGCRRRLQRRRGRWAARSDGPPAREDDERDEAVDDGAASLVCAQGVKKPYAAPV